MHGSQYSYYMHNPTWKSGFGSISRDTGYRTYWVSFTNETDATAVLLRLTDN